MNTKEAKKIRIIDYLKSINIFPEKINSSGSKAFFKSPFRNETTASFNLNLNQNIWYDHGTGEGGNIIDLVIKLNKTNVSGVLEILSSKNLNTFSFQQQNINNTNSSIKIIAVDEIHSFGLIQYLKKRKISLPLAKLFLSEVKYEIASNNKVYYSLGFKNDKGGYELRNNYFKGSNSPKHYTTIPGRLSPELNIFEGFFDFLSALELNSTTKLKFDTLVLNSVANKNKITELVKKYKNLNLFMDNDSSGNETTCFFQSIHNSIVDYSKKLYPNHSDMNEFLNYKQK